MASKKARMSQPRRRFAPATQAIELESIRRTPAPIESYADRQGYTPDFLGADSPVPLPTLNAVLKRDAAMHGKANDRTHVLDYAHFSVAVSKSRRMPIFSACNLDGKNIKDLGRSDTWKYDPRISVEYQLLDEVYGRQQDGFFSRGHMTRRRDPVWGGKKIAQQAESDTFHATNATPQVQDFNAGLWNDIEDYLLTHAASDHMRLCVMTGPVFEADDPVVHGVRIPLRFWKVIAFLHDETGKLAASGYVASQARAVGSLKPAFVFGDIEHQQRPITAIEAMTGLKFPGLAKQDVLAGAGPDFAAALRDVRDIMLA
jgi:endonuclease G